MVGFFHDVVGGGENHHVKHHTHANNPSSMLANVSQSSPVCEVKEQIEWLHFENYNVLDTASYKEKLQRNFIPTTTNNMLIMLGYKTGFAVWTIDVS